MEDQTVSTNPKDFAKPVNGDGGIPVKKRPKVGDCIEFGGQFYMIRKITKKDMLLRPVQLKKRA